MNLEQAVQQAEKIASGQYSSDELQAFLSFMDAADPGQVSQLLEAYQVALNRHPGYTLRVNPDFMDRLKALQPVEDANNVIIPAFKKVVPVYWVRWMAAAVLILLATTGYYWFIARKAPPQSLAGDFAAPKNDVFPGGNKAILTLSGGRQLILDSARQGDLTIDGNARVSKTDSGKLVYHSINSSPDAPTVYNTLTTPRGGQYQITLPDGTKVWLNAASSITYPTAFIGKERKVTITGEAYFEVARNAKMPFSVEENGLLIQVLGTRFNINGYDNEPSVKTTLIEGSVQVRYQKVQTRLEPGMQAQIYKGPDTNNQTAALAVAPANIEQTLAWKNGLFAFTNADLPTVIRQLARWYDVNVTYEGPIPKDVFEFNGKIGKTLTLDQVLKILTKTRVHYTIQGKQLTIRP